MTLRESTTLKVMFWGLALAILANLPFYALLTGNQWPLIFSFPLGWLYSGMSYMGTFFHEIGHTLAAWFYGYPTLPMFDFKHGGGLSIHFSNQEIMILLAVWAAIAYGFWHFREQKIILVMLALALALNLSLAFNPHNQTLISFMGPAAECLIAGFFLFRALLNLAPRGILERFLNALFGCGLMIQVLLNGWGLLRNEAFRGIYYRQKGAHGFGDFDRIADNLIGISFNTVIWAWLLLAVICIIIPLVFYIIDQTHQSYYERYEP